MTGPIALEDLFDEAWYVETYPDAADWPQGPVDHFVRIGRLLGRAPGPTFHPEHYLAINADVAQAGADPLEHYLAHGYAEGRTADEPKLSEAADAAMRKVSRLKPELYMLGRREAVPRLWAEMAETDSDAEVRIRAAYELALMHLRGLPGTGASLAQARAWLDRVLRMPATRPHRRRQIAMSLLCDWRLGRRAPSRRLIEFMDAHDLLHEDGFFALANLMPDIDTRLSWINRALARSGVPPVALDEAVTPYDGLRARDGVIAVQGPRVSVIVAAWRCAESLPTALGALCAQSWRNLEILVVDDASGDATPEVAHAWAKRDRRIRVLEQNVNGGAYVARNRALGEATGEFVTLHDADDWVHPERIERQVRLLEAEPRRMACMSPQVRMSNELCVNRMTGNGRFLIENTSSLLFRRAPIVQALGAWDVTRFAADNEFIRRIRHVFGSGSVHSMPGGPLAFQRNSEGSAVSDSQTGIAGFPYGVRREYRIAQSHFLRTAAPEDLRYDGRNRPYPVPAIMFGDREQAQYETVLGGDLRRPETLAFLLSQAPEAGAVFELPAAGCFDLEHPSSQEARDLIVEENLRVLVYGERAVTDTLILDPSALCPPYPVYMPAVRARRVIVAAPAGSARDAAPDHGDLHVRFDPSMFEAQFEIAAPEILETFGAWPKSRIA